MEKEREREKSEERENTPYHLKRKKGCQDKEKLERRRKREERGEKRWANGPKCPHTQNKGC